MNLRGVRCREEHDLQKRFAALLVEWCGYRNAPCVIPVHALAIPVNFGSLYLILRGSY